MKSDQNKSVAAHLRETLRSAGILPAFRTRTGDGAPRFIRTRQAGKMPALLADAGTHTPRGNPHHTYET